MNSNRQEKKAARQIRDKMIVEALHVNRTELHELGVIKIGLIRHTDEVIHALPDYDAHILVDMQEAKKNLNDFITLLYFLEDLLQIEIDLLLMQPKTPYLDEEILKNTKFIQISPDERMQETNLTSETKHIMIPEQKKHKLNKFSIRRRKRK